MPEFYLIPKRLARKAPVVTAAVQAVEAFVFRATFWLLRRLSVDHLGIATCAGLLREARLAQEIFESQGFAVESLWGDLAGAPLSSESEWIGVVARRD